jgi:hypothetical protein
MEKQTIVELRHLSPRKCISPEALQEFCGVITRVGKLANMYYNTQIQHKHNYSNSNTYPSPPTTLNYMYEVLYEIGFD